MASICIKNINNPADLTLYFDSQIPTVIHLRKLISCQYANGIIPTKLTLSLTIAPNTEISVIDDLCCCEAKVCQQTAWHSTLSFYLHADSKLTYHLGAENKPCDKTANGKNCEVKKELNLILLGKNAQAHATCSCMGVGASSYTFTTIQEHRVPQTTSTLTIKGVLADQARLKSNTIIKVYKDCDAVHALTMNKNLLLSPNAHAQSIPKLEIESNDVLCRHDATASGINQEQLFYFQSRGLSLTQAQQAIVTAFLG